MPTEIERKFLVTNDRWREQAQRAQRMCQGYIAGSAQGSVRVRIAGEQAWLNIKSATLGIERLEYEYAIPLNEAEELLAKLVTGGQIDKTRHWLTMAGHTWEIDEFHGDNQGLVVAELELSAVDEAFTQPDWLGQEVSMEARYYNSELVRHPYKNWSQAER